MKVGISGMEWPRSSPDLNPIERVWSLHYEVTRRDSERFITAGPDEDCIIGEINALFQQLPTAMQRCIAVDGGNNYGLALLKVFLEPVLIP